MPTSKPTTVAAYKKYDVRDHQALATWAADHAERVLPFFTKMHPKDDRPRKAITSVRTWIRTGMFRMADVREASLGSHAAARAAKDNAARFAARAAGQAAGVPHVAQHAYGAPYYGLKAIAAADPERAEVNIAKELRRLSRELPVRLRKVVMRRIIVKKRTNGAFLITIQKGKGF